MKLTADWLTDKATQTVFTALQAAGHQVYAVGGCVRDTLLGMPVDDVDMATSATPDQAKLVFQKAGVLIAPTGIPHGTLTLVFPPKAIQLTSFRDDIQGFGRHARVTFGATLETDAARRDFTMNALYADRDGTVIDPLGGLDDLKAGRVRFVGEPAKRIREDYLRILRFFRFSARYGNPEQGLDAEALAACAEHAEKLFFVSVERVTHEMAKLLGAPNPAPVVASMAITGVLARVLPGADPSALPILIHLESEPSHWLARLAAISDGSGLRLSRVETRMLAALREAVAGTRSPAVLGYTLGALGGGAVALRAALMHAPLPPGWQAEVARGQAAEFPLRAADLPHLVGPPIGYALQRAKDHWLKQDLHPDRAALLHYLGVATNRRRT